MKNNQILKIYGTDYKELTKELLEKAELTSRIPSKNSRICIKPNLVVPTPAKFGATTHPEICAGIIEYLKERDFENIFIAEGCWIGDKTSECFEETGFRRLCDEYNIPFRDVQKEGSFKKQCGKLELSLSDICRDIDFLINVPVLKGHCQVRMTCALKNVKGLVPNSEKRRFHAIGISEPVACLNLGIRQDFIVVDNICGDLEYEGGGNPFSCNCIMAAADPVLMDTYACRLMHLSPGDVPYLPIAAAAEIGSADIDGAEIISLNKGEFDEGFPKFTRLIDASEAVEALDACSSCYANLIPAVAQLKEEGLLEHLNEKIVIGQSNRGKSGRLGVGSCTAGFETCIMGCPPDMGTIYKELKEYITSSIK